MSKQSGFEIKAEQRQSWQSIALVWAGGMICVPCLMVGGVLSGGGLPLPQIVAAILIGYGLICALHDLYRHGRPATPACPSP